MQPGTAERLTERFYTWERRGRGWQTFGFPVDPEPCFHPFFGHYVPPIQYAFDDGRRPTLLSSVARLFTKKEKSVVPDNSWLDIPSPDGYEFNADYELAVYTVVFPKDEKVAIGDMQQLLLMLSYSSAPISFEIMGTGEKISVQVACRQEEEEQVYSQVRAYFPTAILTKTVEGLDILMGDAQTCVIDLGIRDEFMRPLMFADNLQQDPYIGLFGVLEQLQSGERGVVQVLFKGATNPWPESIIRAVSDGDGGSFFADAPEMVKLAQEKVSCPLYGVCVKVGGQARRSERSIEIAQGISSALIQLTASKSNRLQVLSQDVYTLDEQIDDVYLRQSHRLGMLLNASELATLAHFPTEDVASAKLERDAKKTKLAPAGTAGHSFTLGTNAHHGQEGAVTVPNSLRLKHTHIIGATGTGKSTLLLSMIAQDMQQGNGLAVLDPHGDLIETALKYIPEERLGDVVIVDPADAEFPVAFNILSAHSEVEKDILSSDLVAAFRRLSTSWGDQMNSVLANAILVFLESKEGGTLVDLRRFLIEKAFRDSYLKTVQDPHVVYYWQHEYPLLKSSSIGSILMRLDTFLRPKLIRNMVAQKKGLDFENILDSRKILLVKLSQGLIGAENSFLLGTFFVSKMYQAAMARQAKDKEARSDFFLYIDEFQNFITPSMSHILSGARKYHLGLVLAHQDMQQLQKYDTELASSVVVNAGTRICFRLGDADAKRFASGFSYFEASDLENLPTGQAIGRVEQPKNDFNLSTIPLPEIHPEVAEEVTQLAIAKSRECYGTPKEQVEQTLSIPAVQQPIPLKPVEPITPPQDLMQTEIVVEHKEGFIPVEIPRKPHPAQKVETEHRYLQMLIKRMAESRGYKAMIEELTPDGKGRVDVSLERDGQKIAVEISVTTTDTWEAHNVEKCLAAGYGEVIVCSKDENHLGRIRIQLESKLNQEQLAKVTTYSPTEVMAFFDKKIVQVKTTEKVIKGYRVKVEYDTTTPQEMAAKQENITRSVTSSIRKRRQENTNG